MSWEDMKRENIIAGAAESLVCLAEPPTASAEWGRHTHTHDVTSTTYCPLSAIHTPFYTVHLMSSEMSRLCVTKWKVKPPPQMPPQKKCVLPSHKHAAWDSAGPVMSPVMSQSAEHLHSSWLLFPYCDTFLQRKF